MALRIFCLLSLLAFSQAKVFPFFDLRIVNGEDAKIGEIPYQVSIQYNSINEHFCGGSILNNNYVITVAHCVEGKIANDIKVVVGTINLLYPKLQHKIEKIIIHEEYNPFNYWINDIALLKVQIPFTTSTTVRHVPLPIKDYIVKVHDIAVVSRWEGGPSSVKLQRVNNLIANHSRCEYIYNKLGYEIYPTQICAYDPRGEDPRGVCNRDSGGPLTVEGNLIGLVSWTFSCDQFIIPTVFTNVISYLDWIKNNAV